jgi:hypothetical protein
MINQFDYRHSPASYFREILDGSHIIRHGLGIYEQNDGAVYKGYFVNDIQHGLGLATGPLEGMVFCGIWSKDRLVEKLPEDHPDILKMLNDLSVITSNYKTFSEQEAEEQQKEIMVTGRGDYERTFADISDDEMPF